MSSSPATLVPSSSSTVTVPPARATDVALVSTRTSTPASASAAWTSSAAKGSSRASTRGPASITVTFVPSDAYASASSMPTVPPPRTIRLAGTSLAVVASRLVHGFASRRAVDRRHRRLGAGGDDDRLTGDQRLVAHRDRALARDAAVPAHQRDAEVLEPRQLHLRRRGRG